MKELGDVEFEYLFLKDVNLGLCKGCYTCMLRGEERCPLKDDRAAIEKKDSKLTGCSFHLKSMCKMLAGLWALHLKSILHL